MYISKVIISLVASTAFLGSALATKGDATYYDPGLGACGWTNSGSDHIAALNPGNFDGKKTCGRRVRVKRGRKRVDVTIVDLCPGCGPGGIDLSPAAFKGLADLTAGRVQVDWNWI